MAKGSCLCATVQFTVSDEASKMRHCHCSMCRKTHGALFATYFESSELDYTAGKDAIEIYESSPGFQRAFCNLCGSSLPERSSDGTVAVPAGLMDDDPGIRPEAHIFTESKAGCYHITDTLPQHHHYGDGDASRIVNVTRPVSKLGVVSGGCQCGLVTFEYSGAPSMMMNCHCSRCRKAKAAAHATNAFVPGDAFTWTNGEEHVQEYAHKGAKVFGHAFCKTCGSSVPRARADGSQYNVPAGSLTDDPGVDAKGHIFIGSKAPWFDVTENKPQWIRMPT